MPDIDFEAEHDPERAARRSRMRLFRYAKNHGIDASGHADANATANVDRAASESGAPLPGALRERFESSLGADLSSVRVHTGAASASAADSVGAKAYATGQDIHFGAGEYDPSSKDGQHLLAHEVAHTVQQGSAANAQPQAKLEVSAPADAHEHEADRAAEAMVVGAPTHVSSFQGGAGNAGQLQLKPAAKAAQRADIDMPDDYVGKSGAQTLAEFVRRTEHDVTAIADGIDHASSASSLVHAGCARILGGFRQLDIALDHSPPHAEQIHGLMQRLDTAIGRLFAVARQHRVDMRETGLEDVFDHEDHLRMRKDISYGERANRAEHYYDVDFGEAKHHSGPTPDASSVAGDMRDGNATGEASNRDELIREIENLESRMWWALDQAYQQASAVINEPEMPKDPSLLEQLAEMAVGILISVAGAELGGILDLAASGGKAKRVLAGARAALRERVGKDTARALLAGFVSAGAGKQAVTQGATIAVDHLNRPDPKQPSLQEQPGFNPDGLAVSPKKIYLVRAHAHTSEAKTITSKAFVHVSSELKRLPAETLRDLHDSFDGATFNRITGRFRGLLVQEWVNFVKMASDKGFEMRDEATRDREFGTKTPTKLDNTLLPAGVVRIRVTVGPEGQVTFKDASLPGVTSSVLHDLKRIERSLSSLAMYRRIELTPPNAMTLPGGGFDVDPSGHVLGIAGIHGAARAAIAAVAHPVRAVVFNDGDVYAGALALVQKLQMHTTNDIKGNE